MRAFDRNEKVYGDRFRAEFPQRVGHIDNVVGVLPHSQDNAGTKLEPGLPCDLQSVETVFIRMRRADCRVMTGGCVKVMVHAVESRVSQHSGLFFVEEPRRDANLDGVPRLDLADQASEMFNAFLRRPAPGEDHAVTVGPSLMRALRFKQDLRIGFHRILLDSGLRGLRLRAIAAIFGTMAVLHVINNVDRHLLADKLLADGISGVQKRQQLDIIGG